MSIRYRLKRSSGPVHEPIPAHPDAIYRPQNRPMPANIPPADSDAIAPRIMDDNPVVAAPLAAGGDGFSPWWIIGPLLALLAAMALAALAYAAKKKHDSKKQAEEENDRKTNKNEEENPESVDNARKLAVENVPLRSMKSDTMMKEQKRTIPMSFTAKGSSTSVTDPFPSNAAKNEQFDKSPLPVHDLPLKNDSSTLSSTRHSPINVTRRPKPNSDTSKTIHNTLADPLLNSPLKNIRSISAHTKEPNYSDNLPPTSTISPASSTLSTAQKLGQPNDILDLNADILKTDPDLSKKENQPNDSKKAPDDKPPFGQSLTKLGHVDHNGPLKAGQNRKESTLPSSHSGINDSNANLNKKETQRNDSKKAPDDKSPFGQSLTDLGRVDDAGPLKAGENNKESSVPSSHSGINVRNAANKPGGGHINEQNSPEQHGIGKSPLISNFPTGSKRSGKEKPQSQINQIEEEEKSSFSSNLQKQHSSKDSSPSNINKDKQASTLTIHSKHDPLSEPINEKNSTSSRSNEKSSKHNIQPSDQHSMLNKNDSDKFSSHHIQSFTKGLDSNPSDNRLQSHIDSSNPQKSNNPNDDKSDESNTSLTQSDLTNDNKPISLMPNVPQCKTNTSSSDDDYDEVYPIPSNNSPIQQTTSKLNSNLNLNASTYRKNRTSHMRKSLTKRFHLKDKRFHSNTNDH